MSTTHETSNGKPRLTNELGEDEPGSFGRIAPLRTVIEPRPGWRLIDLRELWRYRELLFFLTWRDVKVRYKQTALGVAWAILQPLATMVVFTLFLGRVASTPGVGVPYPLFIFAGLLPWTFFATALASAGQSVVGSQNLVTKVYFPRLLIPMGAVGAGLVDLLIAFGLLLVMMLAYGVAPGRGLIFAPVIALLLTITALGMGALLAALTVAYRDFRHMVPFLVQTWMFATPSIYLQSGSAIAPKWRPFLSLNPAQGLIDNFRRALFGERLDLYGLAVSGVVGVVVLVVGCAYFRRVEREFADII